MSNNNTSIHEFDINLIDEYFAHFERQGPGDPEITLKALGFVEGLNEASRIADIGCGTGGQTMTLGQNVSGTITGLDLASRYIDIFNANAHKLQLNERVKGQVASMKELPFQEKELDLIWCEGAIYNIGYERGLKEWRKFLKPGGYIAVSEASWFANERPAEIEDFWMEAYPQITTIPRCVEQMQNAGYVPIASFVFPEYCWTENYHAPQATVQEAFLKQHAGNKTAEGFIAFQRHEMELYNKYKAYYGYVFYIGKKI